MTIFTIKERFNNYRAVLLWIMLMHYAANLAK